MVGYAQCNALHVAPTIGLLVTSLRDPDAANATASSAASAGPNTRGRTCATMMWRLGSPKTRAAAT